jgi:hypothetical protein
MGRRAGAESIFGLPPELGLDLEEKWARCMADRSLDLCLTSGAQSLQCGHTENIVSQNPGPGPQTSPSTEQCPGSPSPHSIPWVLLLSSWDP